MRAMPECTSSMIGESPAFWRLMMQLKRVSQFDATVLLEGETGTGKELAARFIHYQGARRTHPFIPINCGALPADLAANELFGHQRGAFTGAQDDYTGALQLAHGGTLFLDEVDALPPSAQVSLLRVLQDRRFRPLGARNECQVDVRVIAASNKSLKQLTRSGQFRLDLYYRLELMSLTLPPLRERGADVVLLAEHFLAECLRRYGLRKLRFHPDTLLWFAQYSWPGNVRELENLVHREVLMADDACSEIARPGGECSDEEVPRGKANGSVTMTSSDPLPPYVVARIHARERFDRDYLSEALRRARGNVTRAAQLARQERRAFGKLIKKYSIDITTYRN